MHETSLEIAKQVDFLIVLIGVILGLSIGKLVNFIGEFVYHRRSAEASLTHGLFLAAVFIYQVYYWWDMWKLRDHLVSQKIDFVIFFGMLLIPLSLFCATAVLCPRLRYPPKGEDKLSLKGLFDDNCVPFYAFWVLICSIGIAQGIFIRGEGFNNPEIFIRVASAVVLLIGIVFRNSFLNTTLAVLMLLLLIGYITVPYWEGKIPLNF